MLPKKLIIGHIKHTIIVDIANVTKICLSFLVSTSLNANFCDSFPIKKNYNINAIAPIIGNSPSAATNT